MGLELGSTIRTQLNQWRLYSPGLRAIGPGVWPNWISGCRRCWSGAGALLEPCGRGQRSSSAPAVVCHAMPPLESIHTNRALVVFRVAKMTPHCQLANPRARAWLVCPGILEPCVTLFSRVERCRVRIPAPPLVVFAARFLACAARGGE